MECTVLYFTLFILDFCFGRSCYGHTIKGNNTIHWSSFLTQQTFLAYYLVSISNTSCFKKAP